MARKKKLCIIIAVCLVVIAAGCAWQWNNIMAVVISGKYSKAELSAKISEEKPVSEETIKKLPVKISELTEEEKKKLNDGEISQEDAVKIIVDRADSEGQGENQSESQGESQSGQKSPGAADVPPKDIDVKPTDTPDATEKKPPAEKSVEEQRIQELIASLVVLETSYTDNIDKLVSQAKSEFAALPKSEQTSSKKKKVFLKYLSQASGMESECDATVSGITSELKELLTKTGGDLSIISDIEATYYEKKSVKKAYYISLLKNS